MVKKIVLLRCFYGLFCVFIILSDSIADFLSCWLRSADEG